MMFFGPHAASPPKKTPGRLDSKVTLFTAGISHLSNSMPRSRSIQGKALSWPMARITSSQGMITVSMTFDLLGLRVPFEALEFHAGEHAVLDDETLRRVIDNDLYAFFFGVVQFPGRGFEEAARTARHHLDIFPAQSARRAAAIHRRVADADDQNALADRIGMAESNGAEPVDADVNAIGFVAAGQIRDSCRVARRCR